MQILTVVIKTEHDIILARQKAKKIANFAGLSFIDQTRYVTAVSEITRNAVMYGNGGKIEFSIKETGENQLLMVSIKDNSKKNLPELLKNETFSKNGLGIGINGTRNMMDYFSVENTCSKGNVVTFGKILPKNNESIKMDDLKSWTEQLIKEKPKGYFEEIQQQNQVLMQAMEKLEEKEQELKAKLSETVRLNVKLQRANQDLKDFAYVVSHDLKAPLRGINSLASWLASDYGNKLGDEGNQMIELLLGRIQRMNGLIDGILQYSRVGREHNEIVSINLQDTVEGIIQMIKLPNNMSIIFDNNLPKLYFEETRIIQIFQNLIENAVKYNDKEKGIVSIGYDDEGEMYKFYVSDNGPGIEEKYQNKIFKIFQTLNPRDKVESTGIGLTIVKKIVELYQGKIWLESKMNEGTTFYFTLPKEKIKYETELTDDFK